MPCVLSLPYHSKNQMDLLLLLYLSGGWPQTPVSAQHGSSTATQDTHRCNAPRCAADTKLVPAMKETDLRPRCAVSEKETLATLSRRSSGYLRISTETVRGRAVPAAATAAVVAR